MTCLYKIKEVDNIHKILESNDWDVIELDITICEKKLYEYYIFLTTELQNFLFSFDSKKYIKEEIYNTFKEQGRVGNYHGNVEAWSVSWPVERDIPCPSKSQANWDMYPELRTTSADDFYYAKPQQKYMYGVMNEFAKKFTDRAMRKVLVAKHPPDLTVANHIDGPIFKIHVPLFTNKDAVFVFGEDRDRIYHMEIGKAYLINTTVVHGTHNGGKTDRIHMLSRVDSDYLIQFLQTTIVI